VGALRRDEHEQLDRRPQPRLDELPDLVDGVRSAGLPVRLDIVGPPRPLPATVELAAYRVVQESLTNALRYARSAPTSVALSYLEGGLDLVVENAAPVVPVTERGTPAAGERPANGGTRGLQGLAERAQLKTHVARVFTKLGLRDRAPAVIYGYETGPVTPGGQSATTE
jgi:hypothetical protein